MAARRLVSERSEAFFVKRVQIRVKAFSVHLLLGAQLVDGVNLNTLVAWAEGMR